MGSNQLLRVPANQQELSACAQPKPRRIIEVETYARFPLINALLRAAAALLSTMLLYSVCCTSRNLTSQPAATTTQGAA